MMEAVSTSETSVVYKLHGATSQMAATFIHVVVRTSNLTKFLVTWKAGIM
jgi:hypothetical protein